VVCAAQRLHCQVDKTKQQVVQLPHLAGSQPGGILPAQRSCSIREVAVVEGVVVVLTVAEIRAAWQTQQTLQVWFNQRWAGTSDNGRLSPQPTWLLRAYQRWRRQLLAGASEQITFWW